MGSSSGVINSFVIWLEGISGETLGGGSSKFCWFDKNIPDLPPDNK